MSDSGSTADRVSAALSVIDRTIAPGDTMYTSAEHYFSVGASALRAVLLALDAAGLDAPPRTILDYGCGHGRVMRFLRAAFPEAALLACDIDAPAVAHCVAAFGARAVVGQIDFDRLERLAGIDLIWCGSVLTHLAAAQWPRLLGYFAGALAEGGLAVVTTGGRAVAAKLEQVTDYGLGPQARAATLAAYRSSGFGYNDYPGNKGYGLSVAGPEWVAGQVIRTRGLRLVAYTEAGWDRHLDVVALVKDAGLVLEGR